MVRKYPIDPNDTPETEEKPLADGLQQDEVLPEGGREKICETCPVNNEAEEIRLRALAEMDNFKKRLLRQQEEVTQYATEKLLLDLIPTLDNFDLALQYGSQTEACKDILVGVEMTRKGLLDILKTHGLEQLGKVGEIFDPNIHEALGQEVDPDVPPNNVLNVMQKGYKLKDRLLRPAKVIVNKPVKHVAQQV